MSTNQQQKQGKFFCSNHPSVEAVVFCEECSSMKDCSGYWCKECEAMHKLLSKNHGTKNISLTSPNNSTKQAEGQAKAKHEEVDANAKAEKAKARAEEAKARARKAEAEAEEAKYEAEEAKAKAEEAKAKADRKKIKAWTDVGKIILGAAAGAAFSWALGKWTNKKSNEPEVSKKSNNWFIWL